MKKTDPLNITLVQSTLVWENIDANLKNWDKICSAIKKTDLILLPETFTTGFSMNVKSLGQTMNGSAILWMKELARKKNAAVAGSLIILERKKYYNRFCFVMPNGEFFYYNKRHLFSPAGEDKNFTKGNEKVIVRFRNWNIALFVCYDLRFPVWSKNVNNIFDMMLYTANWPALRTKAWENLLIARAIENQCFVAGINRVGKDGRGIDHLGASVIADSYGNILLQGPKKKSWVKSITITKDELISFRQKFTFSKDADEFTIKR